MAVLPDINVLLPLMYDAHVHHVAALTWFNTIQRRGEAVLCRTSQLGLLRLINNTVVMGADVQDGRTAWASWDALAADERFRFADEPVGLESKLRLLSGAFSHQPKRWQDAYLAAFAIAENAELVTFDTGFRGFAGLRYRVLGLSRD